MELLICYKNILITNNSLYHAAQVTGDLLDHLTSWDALRAALPVGTVSGAPKVFMHRPSFFSNYTFTVSGCLFSWSWVKILAKSTQAFTSMLMY